MNNYVAMLEDDRDDRYLTEEVLKQSGISIPVKYFSKSTELIEYISKYDKPSLILADYNSTPDNGFETLKKLKGDPILQAIPVVILSDSKLDHFKKECYAAGAASFVHKPVKMNSTVNKIGTFFKYWFEVAEL